MTLGNARSAVKTGSLKIHDNLLSWFKAGSLKTHNLLSWFKARSLRTPNDLLSWLFITGTLLMLASVIRMWSHWFEICASLGFHRAAGVLGAVTGAALIVSWWLNTD
ncbi:MAG: hypothetical protein ACREDM_04770 [Methylocella sp.]